MSGHMKAVELLDAIETRGGRASAMSISEVFGVVMSSRYVAPGTAKQPRDFVSFERRVQSVPVPVPTFPTHA